jgi:hypothetical protein
VQINTATFFPISNQLAMLINNKNNCPQFFICNIEPHNLSNTFMNNNELSNSISSQINLLNSNSTASNPIENIVSTSAHELENIQNNNIHEQTSQNIPGFISNQNQWKRIDIDREILHANFSQVHFKTYSNQCVAMSAAAIIKSFLSDPKDWMINDLDEILISGNSYYAQIVAHHKLPNNSLLATHHLLTEISLFGCELTLQTNSSANKDVWKFGRLIEYTKYEKKDRLNAPTLSQAINEFFDSNHHGAIITTRSFTRSIFKKNNFYYLFDSHPILPNGNSAKMSSSHPAAVIKTHNREIVCQDFMNRIKSSSLITYSLKTLESYSYDLDFLDIISIKNEKKSNEKISQNPFKKIKNDLNPPPSLPLSQISAPENSTSVRINQATKMNTDKLSKKSKIKLEDTNKISVEILCAQSQHNLVPMKTQKDSLAYLFKSHLFRKNKTEISRTYWECVFKRTPIRIDKTGKKLVKNVTNCQATFVLNELNEMISSNLNHNHEIIIEMIERYFVAHQSKLYAEKYPRASPSHVAIENEKFAKSPNRLLYISDLKSRCANVFNHRMKINAPRVKYEKVDDIEIPQIMHTTISGKRWILFDSKYESDNYGIKLINQRLIIFSSDEDLSVLAASEQWMCDGTFHSAPELFYQIYTLHGSKFDLSLPLVWGILTNKSESHYSIFRVIRIKLDELKTNGKIQSSHPKYFISDFESAAYKSFEKHFPESDAKGCILHQRRNMMKRLINIRHLSQYSHPKTQQDKRFKEGVLSLAALTYLPEDLIKPTFNRLCSIFNEASGFPQEVI